MKQTTVIDDFAGGLSIDELGNIPPQVRLRRRWLKGSSILPSILNNNQLGPISKIASGPVRPFCGDGRTFAFFDTTTGQYVVCDGLTYRTPLTNILNGRVGTFNLNTSTGNQSITGIGLKDPTVILFFGTTDAGDIATTIDDWNWFYGVGVNSTNRFVYSQNSDDNASAGGNFSRALNYSSKCILLATPGSATVEAAADFVSLDSDGFTINVTTAPASGYRVGYLALNGTDNALTGSFQTIGNNGTKSITGLGYQPECLLLGGMHDTTAPDNNDVVGVMSIGSTSGVAANDYSASQLLFRTAATKTDTIAAMGSGVCYRSNNPYNTATGGSATLAYNYSSFDADGFSLTENYTQGTTLRQFYLQYLALKGGRFYTSFFNLNTTIGNQSITGIGFKPVAVLYYTNFDYSLAPTADGRMCIGVTDGTNMFCMGGRATDNIDPSNTSRFQQDGSIIRKLSVAGAVETDVSIVSLDSDGFTVLINTAPANAEIVGFLAFG